MNLDLKRYPRFVDLQETCSCLPAAHTCMPPRLMWNLTFPRQAAFTVVLTCIPPAASATTCSLLPFILDAWHEPSQNEDAAHLDSSAVYMRDLDSRSGSVSSLGGGGMGDHEEATATTQLDKGDDGTPAAGAPMPYDNTRSASSNGEDRAGGLRRGDIDKLEENAQTMATGLVLRQEKVCVVGVCLILFSANAIVCHGTGVRSVFILFLSVLSIAPHRENFDACDKMDASI